MSTEAQAESAQSTAGGEQPAQAQADTATEQAPAQRLGWLTNLLRRKQAQSSPAARPDPSDATEGQQPGGVEPAQPISAAEPAASPAAVHNSTDPVSDAAPERAHEADVAAGLTSKQLDFRARSTSESQQLSTLHACKSLHCCTRCTHTRLTYAQCMQLPIASRRSTLSSPSSVATGSNSAKQCCWGFSVGCFQHLPLQGPQSCGNASCLSTCTGRRDLWSISGSAWQLRQSRCMHWSSVCMQRICLHRPR